MTDIPETAVEAALDAMEVAPTKWWAKQVRAALSAASPFMGAVPQEAPAEPSVMDAFAEWGRERLAGALPAAEPAPAPVAEPGAPSLDQIAEAINEARYDTDMWRDRTRPVWENEDRSTRDYAFRLARAVAGLYAAPPARHDALREATDAMVEAACRAYWPAHWPRLFDKADLESIRGHMRRAIAAALAALPATAAEPVPPARQDALREALASHITTALDDIDVDTRGRCKWSEVATARDKIYRAVRSAALAPVPATEAREGE